MYLNTLAPAVGAKKKAKRLGRGIGSGKGKTCGRGHKGQHARAGGFHKVGFEGGQMPLQRRLPKFGFNSLSAKKIKELRLDQVAKITEQVIDLTVLRSHGLINSSIQRVKIINSGTLSKPITIKGLLITEGAKKVIEQLGGKVEV